MNNYLKNFDITTKDLRTWNANIIFLKNLKKNIEMLYNINDYNEKSDPQKLKIRKKIIRESLKNTTSLLHHTPAICKSSYIYKNIIMHIEKNDKFLNSININQKSN